MHCIILCCFIDCLIKMHYMDHLLKLCFVNSINCKII